MRSIRLRNPLVAAGLIAGATLTLSLHAAAQDGSIRRIGRGRIEGDKPDFISCPIPCIPSPPDEIEISANGQWIVLASASRNLVDNVSNSNYPKNVFVVEVGTFDVVRVSQNASGVEADGNCMHPAISPNGRYVAFASDATNLVPNDTNSVRDVFLVDRQTGVISCVSNTLMGAWASAPSDYPSVADDGSVAFQSDAGLLDPPPPPPPAPPPYTDQNSMTDVYYRGPQGLMLVSVLFSLSNNSYASADGPSTLPVISGNGTRIAFQSMATNLMSTFSQVNDSNAAEDIYVSPTTSPASVLVSTVSACSFGNICTANSGSREPSISYDGTKIAFESDATDFSLSPDMNGVTDIFLANTTSGAITRVTPFGANGASNRPSIAGSGAWLAFDTAATNLLATPDTNGFRDVYSYDMATGTILRRSEATFPGPTVGASADCVDACAADPVGRLTFHSTGEQLAWTFGCNPVCLAGCIAECHTNLPDVDGFLRLESYTQPGTFCTPTPSTNACLPTIAAWAGTPSATSSAPFVITTVNIPTGKAGYFFYGLVGPRARWGIDRCMPQPTRRLPSFPGSGATGTSCDGTASVDFNAWIQSGADPALQVPGQYVWMQTWSRDDCTGNDCEAYSDAIAFVIQP